MPNVTFHNTNRSVSVPVGQTILEAARLAGVVIPASCGGKGLCGKCRVRILEGKATPSVGHEHALSPSELDAGWRLACLSKVEGDLKVMVPAMPSKTLVLTHFESLPVEPDGHVHSIPLDMAAPSLEDQASDLERLESALSSLPAEISALARRRSDVPAGNGNACAGCAVAGSMVAAAPLPLLREIPRVLRQGNFKANAIISDQGLAGLEPSNAGVPLLGLAVDVGTTTIAGVLVDLSTGANLATSSCTNPQAVRGDDVISRIEHSLKGDAQLRELQQLVIDAINGIIKEACRQADLSPRHIYSITIAGNTTMEQLLLGICPIGIGESPFIPAGRKGICATARELGIEAAPGARVHTLPCISGYVGGDITAGLLANGVHQRADRVLFIDVGTNGEMALRAGGVTYTCSTAAGPAFEGARISCGMRAATGAINHVEIGPSDLVIKTVQEQPARGICGTALLDAVAALLELGIVDETGRIVDADELPQSLPPALKARVDYSGKAPRFIMANPTCENCPIVALTQQDIRELQLAKGAVAAGVQVLLNAAGIGEGDLDAVLLAGAFGSHLKPASAQRIGLLPVGTPSDRIRFVGNAALAGARMALLNLASRRECESLSAASEYLELSGRSDFQEAFMMSMSFPEKQ